MSIPPHRPCFHFWKQNSLFLNISEIRALASGCSTEQRLAPLRLPFAFVLLCADRSHHHARLLAYRGVLIATEFTFLNHTSNPASAVLSSKPAFDVYLSIL